jgi:hypothetical protein
MLLSRLCRKYVRCIQLSYEPSSLACRIIQMSFLSFLFKLFRLGNHCLTHPLTRTPQKRGAGYVKR